MILPASHPRRLELNDEVHARPPEALSPGLGISYLALLTDPARRDASFDAVCELARRSAVAPPLPGASHFSATLGGFRLRWERHTEFSRFMFIVERAAGAPFEEPAIAAVPADWVQSLPGELLVATHLALVPGAPEMPDVDGLAMRLFDGNWLVGGTVSGGAARVFTDFRIHPGGFSRILVEDRSTTPRQAGRLIQRLLEIDTYRMLALLALPMARETVARLAEAERELAQITSALVRAPQADEPELLERLTRLAAAVEMRESETLYRFSASAAYYVLVQQRIAELREIRIEGMQTLQEFTERRLAPAMNTCRAVADRQDALSRRVARATQLLSTRVDVSLEKQNHEVLASMDRRARQQLRLQQTVEGLSVAAITYYFVSLIAYLAKGVQSLGPSFDVDMVTGVAIPLVAGVVWMGLRRYRRKVKRQGEKPGEKPDAG